MATADVIMAGNDAAYVWKPYWDVNLDQPTGSWWAPNRRFDPDNGGFFSDRPVYGAPATVRAVPLGQHSAGAGPVELPPDVTSNPEWRHAHLTIDGLARAKYEKEVAMGKHAMGGTVDVWSYILGPSPYVLSGLDHARSDMWNMPTPLAGKPSPILDETIEHLVTAQANELWDELAPSKLLDLNTSNVVHWTVIQHQPAMARETTPMGLPTLVDAKAWTEKAELRLYAISGRIPLQFWMTEMGSRFWWEQLITIASGIVAASQFSAAITIASIEALYYENQMRVNMSYKPTFDWRFNNMARTFALFQRPEHNWFNILMKQMEDINRIKGADTGRYVLVTTPEAAIALTTGNKDGISYYVSGPDGPARLNQPLITKMKVFTTDMYTVPSFRMPNNHMVQPFAVPFDIGERIDFFRTPGMGDTADDWKLMDRRVYTFHKQWVEVTFTEAIDKLALWLDRPDPATGIEVRPPNDSAPRGPDDPPSWWNLNKATYPHLYDYYPWYWKTVPAGGEVRGWNLFPEFPKTKANAIDFRAQRSAAGQEQDGYNGIQVIMAQLHQRGFGHNAYNMLPGQVLLRVRKEGHAVIEDSLPDHMHTLVAQYSAGTAVPFAKNCSEISLPYIAEIGEGHGVEPIFPDRAHYNPTSRLRGSVVGDAIYMAMPSREHYKLDQVPTNMNMRGYIEDDLCRVYLDTPNNRHANSYPGCRYYDSLYGWTANKCGSPGQREYPDGYRMLDMPVNICVRQACYQQYSGQTKGYTIYRMGNGFWGMDGTYEGAGDHRGAGCFKKDPPRGKYSLA